MRLKFAEAFLDSFIILWIVPFPISHVGKTCGRADANIALLFYYFYEEVCEHNHQNT